MKREQIWPSCRLCNSPSKPFFVAGEHRMFRCCKCRSSFVYPVPTKMFLDEFYATFHMSTLEGGYYDEVEDRMAEEFPKKTRLVASSLEGKKGAKVLDVGCGKGFFVKALIDRGLCAKGIDISKTAVSYAQDVLRVPVSVDSITDLVNRSEQYDIVTLWATIEHLADPISTLQDIFKVLSPGGRLFLDTGIGDDWLDRLLPGHVQWYDPPQHLFVFSDSGLAYALNSAGFSIVKIDRNFERTRLRKIAKLIRNAAVAASLRIVSELGRLDTGSFGFVRFPIGNSMSVVAEKPATAP
jgi:SAM-dependent methyltransferase